MKYLFYFIFGVSLTANAQFNQKLIGEKLTLPPQAKIEETICQIGKSFLGTPYEGGTLEGPEEKLVCKLDAFDCYTFVENVLAISLTKHSQNPTFENYIDKLIRLRYRNGNIDGYTSRIHYFAEWAKLAQAQKILVDMTPAFGEKMIKPINFMGTHRAYYPSFKTDNKIHAEVLQMEKKLEKYTFYYIKKENFSTYEAGIKNGDIIAFTSNVAGLDVNHEGFAIWQNGKLKLMHASLEQKKVIISDETLLEYMNRIKKHSGVMVLRVNQPLG
jgi:hypothetical protein